ncbi:hypothetical protein [Parafrankia sp. EUN1f]|uniref:hypothetical protein n=1 Tax=Parafrankia sp. EUN1f TaxID=102897 RepID=UPI0001C455B3|nr:hypothetical protein [Parafrankia sp. EUN1f]EFC84664.1 hypothetical protein FrEUN1fDRAFT_2219 [Parafrankia sp. EUN1f]
MSRDAGAIAVVATASLTAAAGFLPAVGGEPRPVGLIFVCAVLAALLAAAPWPSGPAGWLAVPTSVLGWFTASLGVLYGVPDGPDLRDLAVALARGPADLLSQARISGGGRASLAVVPSALVWLASATGTALARRATGALTPLLPALAVAVGANVLGFRHTAWQVGAAAGVVVLTSVFLLGHRDRGNPGVRLRPADDSRPTSWRRALAAMALVTVLGGAAVTAGLAVGPLGGRAVDPALGGWAIAPSGQSPDGEPSGPESPTRQQSPSDKPPAPATMNAISSRNVRERAVRPALFLLALLLALLLAFVAMAVVVRVTRRARRWRRRTRGGPAARLLAAWRDTVEALGRAGLPVGAELTIGELVDGAVARAGPSLGGPLRALAGLAAPALYDPAVAVDDTRASTAWRHRDACVTALLAHTPRAARTRPPGPPGETGSAVGSRRRPPAAR